MSRILLIGDTHFSLGYPKKTDEWFKIHTQYFNEFLLPLVKKRLTKDDIIVHLGDMFHDRNVVPINISNYALSVLEDLSKVCPVHILVGNHDIYTKSTNDINTIRQYKYIPNVFIYENTTKIQYNNKSILMMPWVEGKKEQIDLLKKYKGCDYLFCHSDLNGAKMHLTSVAHKNNDKIDLDEFNGYKNVYSGHIHLTQKHKNFTFVGSIFDMDRNDLDNDKGIYILDTDNDTEEFILNTVSPKFKKIYVLKEEDISKLENANSNDYNDLYLSNTLLMNRKFKRKLDAVLEKISIKELVYIDDLVKEEVEIKNTMNEDVLDDEFIPKIEMEYTEIIRQHINNQTYSSDKIKKGILSEFDNIVDIYKK